MANISNAVGTITFDDGFYASNKHLIDQALADIVTANDGGAHYGFMSFEHIRDGEFNFDGIGRWTFDHTLYNMLKPSWWAEDVTPAMKWLYDALRLSDQEIEISFTDSECGCEVLYAEDGIIHATTDHRKLCYDINCEDDATYTLPNLFAYGVRDEAFPITNEEALDDFITNSELPKERRDEIIKIINNDEFLQGYVDYEDDVYELICNQLGIDPDD